MKYILAACILAVTCSLFSPKLFAHDDEALTGAPTKPMPNTTLVDDTKHVPVKKDKKHHKKVKSESTESKPEKNPQGE